MSNETSEELTIVVRVLTELDAVPIVAALKEQGIVASVTGGFTAGFIAEAPGDIQIRVFKRDHERAAKIVAELKQGTEPIDWDTVDVGEPED